MCTVPLEGSVRHSWPMGVLRSCSPLLHCLRGCCAVTIQILSAHGTALLRPQHCSVTPEKPFLPVSLQGVPLQFCCRWRKDSAWQNWAVQTLYTPLDTAWHRDIKVWVAGVTANPICVLKQIFGEGPAWPLQTQYFRIADNELSR